MSYKKESKIINEKTEDKVLQKAFDKKFNSLNLGRRMTWFDEPIKTIKRGDEIYHVSEASFFSVKSNKESSDVYKHAHVFLIEKNGQFSKVLFTSEAKPFLKGWNKKEHVEVAMNGKHISLPLTTDIFDVYDLRYRLRDNREARHFMNDFVILGQAMRKHYKLYEQQQLYRERQAVLLQRKVFDKRRFQVRKERDKNL